MFVFKMGMPAAVVHQGGHSLRARKCNIENPRGMLVDFLARDADGFLLVGCL